MDDRGDAPDLMSLGQHCSVADCGQRDFLPFRCDCCHRTFCLEHRTYAGHACSKANQNAETTIVCPLCARAIKIPPGQDPNQLFEQHTASACDPSNYARVMQKKRCPVPGCRERLTSVNTYACKQCAVSVCLKHRFPDDHACTRKPAQQGSAQPGAVASLRRFLNLDVGPSVVRAQPGQAATARAAAATAAPKRQGRQGNASRPQQAQPAARSASQAGAGPEVCPVCSARFHAIADLIAHARVHQSPAADTVERCPHCRAAFADAVALVEHVERQHGSSSTACVLS